MPDTWSFFSDPSSAPLRRTPRTHTRSCSHTTRSSTQVRRSPYDRLNVESPPNDICIPRSLAVRVSGKPLMSKLLPDRTSIVEPASSMNVSEPEVPRFLVRRCCRFAPLLSLLGSVHSVTSSASKSKPDAPVNGLQPDSPPARPVMTTSVPSGADPAAFGFNTGSSCNFPRRHHTKAAMTAKSTAPSKRRSCVLMRSQ